MVLPVLGCRECQRDFKPFCIVGVLVFFSVFVILLNLKDFGPLVKQMELVQSRTCCPRNDVPS